MNHTTKKVLKEVSSLRKQSFPIRDKKDLPSEDRATCRGHDLSAEGLHRDLPDLGEISPGPGSSQMVPGGIQSGKPLGYGDGLCTRIRLLEELIHGLTLKGDSEGLREALKEYCEAWIELERGFLCK